MAGVHKRTKARASALAVLYSSDITDQDAQVLVDEGRYPAEDFEFPEYAEALVRGVAAHVDEIDDRLDGASENWAVDRMPVVDRALLRMAVYEMFYVDDVPVSVTINEAVELAKSFGGEDDSPRFVNGVLGRIARGMEGVDEADLPAEDLADDVAEAADVAAAADDAESDAPATEDGE